MTQSSRPTSSTSRLANCPCMLSLPFDIIHILFDFTTVGDLINFCSTCKALHAHLANDSLWKRLCSSYGLRNFTHFGGLSPFTIYTKLIHPYGPMFGLWANDHPFRGNVIEFKLYAGDENEQGGITGEVWSFATHVDRDPLPPEYIRAMKISFECDPEEGEAGHLSSAAEADARAKVRVSCYSDPSGPSTRHHATLYVRAETTTAHRIEFYRHTVLLPEFPMYDSAWCDETPRLPRLPVQSESELDQSTIIRIYPASRLPLIWVGARSIRKPPAISIRCSLDPESCPCAALHVPSIRYESLDQRPPRYYPLRRTILPGVDPQSADWSLQSMVGLWYGSFGVDGTELLYIAFADYRGGELVATKITGDVHVPRGGLCWTLNALEEGSEDAAAARDRWTTSLHAASARTDSTVLSPARILSGKGIIAPEGFR